MENNPYLPRKYEIKAIIPETNIDYTYRLECDIKPENGQFVEVSIPQLGEAPISVSDFGDGYIDLTIRHVGRVTNYMSSLKAGDYFHIRGPYGKGFPIERYRGKRLIIITGGTGLAPVKNIINYFHRNSEELQELDLLMGFKSPEDILFRTEIDEWKKNDRFKVMLTVDSAKENWHGRIGLVTGLISELEGAHGSDTEIIVVGPPMMMKYTCMELIKHNFKENQIWVSFERKMSCGIGKCGHCKIDEVYVCLEGPVFNYSRAKNLID